MRGLDDDAIGAAQREKARWPAAAGAARARRGSISSVLRSVWRDMLLAGRREMIWAGASSERHSPRLTSCRFDPNRSRPLGPNTVRDRYAL